jgi:hypothetical protein
VIPIHCLRCGAKTDGKSRRDNFRVIEFRCCNGPETVFSGSVIPPDAIIITADGKAIPRFDRVVR